ncbi:MAG: HAMP domain-containing histidine kinase [Clostridia bacterium]|nr:HAMP domain-containing histidine kinase [Clostridia bacterium]
MKKFLSSFINFELSKDKKERRVYLRTWGVIFVVEILVIILSVVIFIPVSTREFSTENLYYMDNERIGYRISGDEKITKDNFIASYSDDFFGFPFAIALYDSDGKLLHINSTIVSFFVNGEEKYCYIEEYLNETQKNEFDSMKKQGYLCDVVVVESLTYYEQNGVVVPVEMVISFCDHKKDTTSESKKYKFSDYSGETNTVTIKDYERNRPVILKPSFYYTSPDNDYKIYYECLKQVSSLNFSDYDCDYELKESNVEDFHSVSLNGNPGNQELFVKIVEIDEENYFLVFKSKFNKFSRAFDDSQYLTSMLFVIMVFNILLLFIPDEFLRKYRERQSFEEIKSNFTSAMAHEMKTPIAIIQNQCECILENIAPENNNEYVSSIYDEATKMNKLVADMLQYNRISQISILDSEKTDLSEIVNNEIDKYKKQFEIHKKQISVEIETDKKIKCDRTLIALVIDNFLSNAVKHTEEGGEIKVTVKNGVEGVKVIVFNSGSQIANDEKDKIWSVLYKTNKSRTDRDKSSGVGLAVSAKILDLHKANYGCQNVRDGVEFYFTIK